MDDIAKHSKASILNANRKNQKLERSLLSKTKVFDKKLKLVEREKREITNTRRNIAEEIDSGRRALDMSRLSKTTLNSESKHNSLNKASIALIQSKSKLDAAIEKIKTYKFQSSSVGENGNASTERDENDNLRFSMPLLKETTSSYITESALENRDEIDSLEKVLRYIRLQRSMGTEDEPVSCIENDDQVFRCETPYLARPDSMDRSGNCISLKEEKKQEREDKRTINCITAWQKSNPAMKPRHKILNRRHSVLGINLNVPISVSDPADTKMRRKSIATIEYNPSTEIDIDYAKDTKKQGMSSDKKPKRRLSVDSVSCLTGKSQGHGQDKPCNRRRSISMNSFLPFAPASLTAEKARRQPVRRYSLPLIACRTADSTVQSKVIENQREMAVLQELSVVDEIWSQHS